MPKHAIITRRYSQDKEAYEYSLSDEAESASTADNKAAHMKGVPGDIVIVCDMAHITELPKHAKRIYVMDGSGKARKAPKLPDRIGHTGTWPSAWEGPEARADNMLGVALKFGVDIKLIVLAGCECISAIMEYVDDGKSDVMSAIELARSWTMGKVDIAEIRLAKKRIRSTYSVIEKQSGQSASSSALAAADSLMDIITSQREGEDIAAGIAFSCSRVKAQALYLASYRATGIASPIKYRQEQQKSISDLSEQVRSVIPLELVLSSKKR